MSISKSVVLGAAVLAATASAAGKWSETPGQYAVLETNLGTIVCRLFPDKAPLTVKNFTELANGTKTWKDPVSGKDKKTPYYDGIIFHRVIRGFVIQGGDPTGTGRGGPGYSFEDEIKPELKFDKKGVLAMANAGPDTNGSQFFITLDPQPGLPLNYTIFGEVVDGLDVVDAIGIVPVQGDRPLNPPVMKTVRVKTIEKK